MSDKSRSLIFMSSSNALRCKIMSELENRQKYLSDE